MAVLGSAEPALDVAPAPTSLEVSPPAAYLSGGRAGEPAWPREKEKRTRRPASRFHVLFMTQRLRGKSTWNNGRHECVVLEVRIQRGRFPNYNARAQRQAVQQTRYQELEPQMRRVI